MSNPAFDGSAAQSGAADRSAAPQTSTLDARPGTPGADSGVGDPGKADPGKADPGNAKGGSAEVGQARLYRSINDKVIAGVAGGLADHLQLPVLYVRIGFVVTTFVGGFGLFIYAALWIFAPVQQIDELPPGLAAASRDGRRPTKNRLRGADAGFVVALLAVAGGGLLLLQNVGLGLDPRIMWPLIAVVAGAAIVWSTTDVREIGDERAPAGGRWSRTRLVLAARALGGVALVSIGVVVYLAGQGELQAALNGLLGTVVILAGVVLLAGPWAWRQSRALAVERRERILSEQRADVAAHLHDSVLQTLALIQQQADDPRAVGHLARRQERELRAWLFRLGEPEEVAATSLRAALEAAAADVEDLHTVAVEVVVVGDALLDERLTAVVAASREAMVNAARHSGAAVVDVYAELAEDAVEVFIRDRGVGFDPDDLPNDRQGVAGSILGRMQRNGGTAVIVSEPGEGTEVRLRMAGPHHRNQHDQSQPEDTT